MNLKSGLPYNCSQQLEHTDDTTDIGCFLWQGAVTLNLHHTQIGEHSMCINVSWKTERFTPILKDCFNISRDYGMWYGGFTGPNSWPLGVKNIDTTSYLPGEVFGNIVERFWFSSKGVAIVASPEFPLQLEVKDRQVCLSSWYGYSEGMRRMSYSVCRSDNHRIVHYNSLKQFFPLLSSHNFNFTQFSHPIIIMEGNSSAPVFKTQFQSNYSFILYNNNEWTKSSQANSSVSDTRRGVTISPIVPLQGPVTPEYLNSELWLKSSNSEATQLFLINNTLAILMNTSSESLWSHISNRIPSDKALVKISESGIAHITGQHQYSISEINNTLRFYTHRFMKGLLNQTSTPVMTSVLSGTDRCSVIVSLSPITDLARTVRDLVQTSILGYNVISPGLIRGDLSPTDFIRAVQVAVFAPVIEFSDSVFNYDESTLSAWREWMERREEFLNVIQQKMKTDPLSPMYTPVWWHDIDGQSYNITDEFIFNGTYLVAPIVDPTSTSRTVYFPPGYGIAKAFLSRNGLRTQKLFKVTASNFLVTLL